MRLWSFHPKYLDQKGICGLWKEALLAQKCLNFLGNGLQMGYQNHSQLIRFKSKRVPERLVSLYLHWVWLESRKRKYNFNRELINDVILGRKLAVTSGQLIYEWEFYLSKIKTRSPETYYKFSDIKQPDLHPIFYLIDGGIESWEVQKEYSHMI